MILLPVEGLLVKESLHNPLLSLSLSPHLPGKLKRKRERDRGVCEARGKRKREDFNTKAIFIPLISYQS